MGDDICRITCAAIHDTRSSVNHRMNLEGYVYKRGGGNPDFKRRFFSLQDGVLRYFITKRKLVKRGFMPCTGLSVIEDAGEHEEKSGRRGGSRRQAAFEPFEPFEPPNTEPRAHARRPHAPQTPGARRCTAAASRAAPQRAGRRGARQAAQTVDLSSSPSVSRNLWMLSSIGSATATHACISDMDCACARAPCSDVSPAPAACGARETRAVREAGACARRCCRGRRAWRRSRARP